MNSKKARFPLLFEVAWEVCNQIGGIYTVIKSKTPSMLSRWGNNYVLLGPYQGSVAPYEFETSPLENGLNQVITKLELRGVRAHFGRWLIPGKPQVILLDYLSRFSRLAEDKYLLWKDHGIDSPADDADLNNTIAFGFALSEFFQILVEQNPELPVIAHFHEWMTGVAIPRIKHLGLRLPTVFTTHATLLGRYMASDNPNFYDELSGLDPFHAVEHYNIRARFLIERAAAQQSDVFTTISSVTAREAEQFLGRSPDVLVPNGLSLEKLTAVHEFQVLHQQFKQRIHEFVMGHFFPSYNFDLDRTIYIFTSGRYEYRNKGFDVFIEALHRLSLKLKELFDPPNVVAFLITRAATKSINVSVLQRHTSFEDLKHICEELKTSLGATLLNTTASGRLPGIPDLLPHEFQVRLTRAMYARKSDKLPAIVTHDMWNDGGDAILCHLRHRHLFNQPNNPVKVIFHPDFLNAVNPLFNLDYDQFVRGCHLGVFPSYYEPWGYTPVECLALGIPTVTSDLAGFGNFSQQHLSSKFDSSLAEHGNYVLKRLGRSADSAIEDLSNYLYRFVQQNRRQRIELRNRAQRLSEYFEWSQLIPFYEEAHDRAIDLWGP